MKKYIILFIAMIISVFATAQTVTYPVVQPDITYTYVSTDYNLTNTTVRNFVFPAFQHEKSTQDYVIKLDSVSGNHTAVAVVLYGGKSAIKGDYTQIATATWKRTTADTVIVLSNTTANRYRYFKITLTGTGTGVTKVSDQELKLWRE